MNRNFRLVWCSTRNAFIVAPECARARGRASFITGLSLGCVSSFLFLAGLCLGFSPVLAQIPPGPVEPVLRAGSATIDLSNAQRAVVQQSSQKAVIDWRQFNVAKDSSIQFVQPNASAIALNRVTGAQASRIDGSILANGQVWLINPNGVLIGKSGRINTHGFLASTLGLSTDNFMQGNYSFQADLAGFGSVVNEGQIISAQGGYAVLAGRQVKNDGLIWAQMGQVVLASGKAATLDLAGDGLLRFAVTAPVDDMPAGDEPLIENTGRLSATAGRVLITAQAATDMMRQVVNVQGVVEATSVREVNGEIVLEGGPSGTVAVSGELNASGAAAGEKGGAIKVFGQRLHLQDGTALNATGDAGGGDIYVGGGWQGALVDGRPSALEVRVDAGASLDASALGNGNGGTVVAWSDVGNPASKTYALGSFRARGGPQGADGGRIETSGYWLGVDSIKVDAGASQGKAGLWLLDPADIYIGSSYPYPYDLTYSDSSILSTDGSDPDYATSLSDTNDSVGSSASTDTLGSSFVDVQTLGDALSSGSNVTVSTVADPPVVCSSSSVACPVTYTISGGDLVSGSGSIIVEGFLTWASDSKLTLEAVGNVDVQGDIQAPGSLEVLAGVGSSAGATNIFGLTGDGSISLGGGVVVNQTGNSEFKGQVTNYTSNDLVSVKTALVKKGSGSLTLSGYLSHSGVTRVEQGILKLGYTDLNSSASSTQDPAYIPPPCFCRRYRGPGRGHS